MSFSISTSWTLWDGPLAVDLFSRGKFYRWGKLQGARYVPDYQAQIFVNEGNWEKATAWFKHAFGHSDGFKLI